MKGFTREDGLWRASHITSTKWDFSSGSGGRVGEAVIDSSTCDCCQTDVAVSANGPIAVYRDRTHDEIRDIFVTRFEDGSWQPGERLHADNWEIPGCPVHWTR